MDWPDSDGLWVGGTVWRPLPLDMFDAFYTGSVHNTKRIDIKLKQICSNRYNISFSLILSYLFYPILSICLSVRTCALSIRWLDSPDMTPTDTVPVKMLTDQIATMIAVFGLSQFVKQQGGSDFSNNSIPFILVKTFWLIDPRSLVIHSYPVLHLQCPPIISLVPCPSYNSNQIQEGRPHHHDWSSRTSQALLQRVKRTRELAHY